MINWRKLYFVRLYFYNKWLCVIVFLFFALNIAANLIVPTELTPIYNWNLYADPIEETAEYSFSAVRYNDNRLLRFERTWNEPQQLLLTNPLELFISLQVYKNTDYAQVHFTDEWLPNHPRFQKLFPTFRNYNNQQELKQFPAWYKSYLQQYTGEQIDSIKVYKQTVVFAPNGGVNEKATQLLYIFK